MARVGEVGIITRIAAELVSETALLLLIRANVGPLRRDERTIGKPVPVRGEARRGSWVRSAGGPGCEQRPAETSRAALNLLGSESSNCRLTPTHRSSWAQRIAVLLEFPVEERRAGFSVLGRSVIKPYECRDAGPITAALATTVRIR